MSIRAMTNGAALAKWGRRKGLGVDVISFAPPT